MLNNDEQKKIRLLQNKYHREWRAKNQDKVKAINERYWKKKLKNENRKEQTL